MRATSSAIWPAPPGSSCEKVMPPRSRISLRPSVHRVRGESDDSHRAPARIFGKRAEENVQCAVLAPPGVTHRSVSNHHWNFGRY